jgi:hypothetical protein
VAFRHLNLLDPPFLARVNQQPAVIPQVWDFRRETQALDGWSVFGSPTGFFTGSGGALSANLNVISARPFFVGNQGLQISGLQLLGGGAGVNRLGIYRCAAPSAKNLYPTTLVKDFGDLVTTATPAVWTLPGSVFLPNGLYYTAYKLTSGGSAFLYNYSGWTDSQVLGFTTAGLPNTAITVADMTAGLPATFPSGGVCTDGERCPDVGIYG